MKKFLVTFVITLTLVLGAFGRAFAYDLPSMPENGIYDPMGLLSETTIRGIEEQNALAAQTDLKPQVAVVVIDSLEGESVEAVANQFASTWQVGFPDTNAGTLLLLAIDDREYRFELSDNASEHLTEMESYYIGENSKHYLRAANYDAAVRQMTTDMFTELRGEKSVNSEFNLGMAAATMAAEGGLDNDYLHDTESASSDLGGLEALLALFPFLGFILALVGGNGGSSYRRGRRSSTTRRSSSGSRIGRGGGGFSGRGSSGKW